MKHVKQKWQSWSQTQPGMTSVYLLMAAAPTAGSVQSPADDPPLNLAQDLNNSPPHLLSKLCPAVCLVRFNFKNCTQGNHIFFFE